MPKKSRKFLDDFLPKVQAASTRNDLRACAREVTEYYGFDGFSYYHYDAGTQQWSGFDFRPKHFLRTYEKLGGIYTDPIAFKTATNACTFRWDQALNGLELSKAQLELMGIARDFGIQDGISSGVFGATPIRNALNWYSASYSHVRDVFNAAGDELASFSVAFSAAYDAMCAAPEPPKLTPREVEVLNWVARGKTSDDVADILNLSSSTVETHLRAAASKLNAANRTHAVAKALTYGLIIV